MTRLVMTGTVTPSARWWGSLVCAERCRNSPPLSSVESQPAGLNSGQRWSAVVDAVSKPRVIVAPRVRRVDVIGNHQRRVASVACDAARLSSYVRPLLSRRGLRSGAAGWQRTALSCLLSVRLSLGCSAVPLFGCTLTTLRGATCACRLASLVRVCSLSCAKPRWRNVPEAQRQSPPGPCPPLH